VIEHALAWQHTETHELSPVQLTSHDFPLQCTLLHVLDAEQRKLQSLAVHWMLWHALSFLH
jgi:hypothetical protein